MYNSERSSSKVFQAVHKPASISNRRIIKLNNPFLHPLPFDYTSLSFHYKNKNQNIKNKNKPKPSNFQHFKRQILFTGLILQDDAMNTFFIKTSNNLINPPKFQKDSNLHILVYTKHSKVCNIRYTCSNLISTVSNCHVFAASAFAYVLLFSFWHNGYWIMDISSIFSHLLSRISALFKFLRQESCDSSFSIFL